VDDFYGGLSITPLPLTTIPTGLFIMYVCLNFTVNTETAGDSATTGITQDCARFPSQDNKDFNLSLTNESAVEICPRLYS
jgi:hypothetical protein